jgi:hypothetical protein
MDSGAQARAADHNKYMNLYDDRGDAKMAKKEAENYIYWTKSAKWWSFWDWLLP